MDAFAASGNLFELLRDRARADPGRAALVDREGTLTYADLERRADRIAGALGAAGVSRGDRAVVLVPISRDLYVLLLALLRLGATAVFIEPGLGPREIVRACERAEARAFIGVRRAHLLRLASRTLRRIPLAIVARGTGLPGTTTLDALTAADGDAPVARADDTTPALLTFTSGTGGPPKILARSHALLNAQHRVLLAAFPMHPDDRTFSAAPLFALHDLAAGATVVLPPGIRAGRVTDRRALVAALAASRVSVVRVDPRAAAALVEGCAADRSALADVRAVFVGGAPVGAALLANVRVAFPSARTYVAYGSSEAEPIAAIAAAEVESEAARLTAAGHGHCVGLPIPPTELRIEGADDEGIGEIAVRGPHVNATGWHRTGDTGYRDARGRVWLLGREADRVCRAGADIHAYAVEPVVETLPFVDRCALVGIADPRLGERTVLVVAPRTHWPFGLVRRREWRRRIEALCATHAIAIDEIRWSRRLPLEHRHRAKIQRGDLRRRIVARPVVRE